MLPEVEAYFAVEQERINEWNRWDREFSYGQGQIEDVPDDELPAWSQAGVARELESRKIARASRERRAVALNALKNSSDPLVRFIVTTPWFFEGYFSFVTRVTPLLQALPMTREEVEDFRARNQQWSEIYDRFFEEAERAGVLPK